MNTAKASILRALVAGALLGTGGTLCWLAGVWLYVWRMRAR